MGTGHSKHVDNVGSIPDMLPDLIGCDTKGTVLCSENDTSITCLNGGVCALFLKEVEDACEMRCRCNTDYIGKHCEFYNGFFTATVTIMVGCLLAVIFTVFVIIIIWYCCNRKSLKDRGTKDMEHMRAKRVSLTDRVMNHFRPGSVQRDQRIGRRIESGQTQVHYPMDGDIQGTHVPKGFTSRSYSVYDNVQMDLDDDDQIHRYPTDHRGQRFCISPNGSRETSRLLAYDETDSKLAGNAHHQSQTDQRLIQMNQICPDDEVDAGIRRS